MDKLPEIEPCRASDDGEHGWRLVFFPMERRSEVVCIFCDRHHEPAEARMKAEQDEAAAKGGFLVPLGPFTITVADVTEETMGKYRYGIRDPASGLWYAQEDADAQGNPKPGALPNPHTQDTEELTEKARAMHIAAATAMTESIFAKPGKSTVGDRTLAKWRTGPRRFHRWLMSPISRSNLLWLSATLLIIATWGFISAMRLAVYGCLM